MDVDPRPIGPPCYLILACRKIKVINRFVTVCILVGYQWLVYSHIQTRSKAAVTTVGSLSVEMKRTGFVSFQMQQVRFGLFSS